MSLIDHKLHNFMYHDNLFDIITLQYSVMFINLRKRKENNFFNLFIDKKNDTISCHFANCTCSWQRNDKMQI